MVLSFVCQGINISHFRKRKIIFKMPFWGDMLVPWRVISLLIPPYPKLPLRDPSQMQFDLLWIRDGFVRCVFFVGPKSYPLPMYPYGKSLYKAYMDVSENSGTPKSSHFNRVFHYKPSILGYLYFWKHPYGGIYGWKRNPRIHTQYIPWVHLLGPVRGTPNLSPEWPWMSGKSYM